jgi:hypothetical protein
MRYHMPGLCLDDYKHYIVDNLILEGAQEPILDENLSITSAFRVSSGF